MKTPDQFSVNSALMVAMLVRLLLFLIASNTTTASSFEVSFEKSCCKGFSFDFVAFFLPNCQSLLRRDGNFLFSSIRVVVSL